MKSFERWAPRRAFCGGVLGPVVAAAFTVSSCSDRIAEAQNKADFLDKHGTLGEACDAKRAVQALYADRRDDEGYAHAKLMADVTCGLIRYEGADMPANNEERERIERQPADDVLNAAANTDANAGNAITESQAGVEQTPYKDRYDACIESANSADDYAKCGNSAGPDD